MKTIKPGILSALIFTVLSIGVAQAQGVSSSGGGFGGINFDGSLNNNPAVIDVYVDDDGGNPLQSPLPGSLSQTYYGEGGSNTASAELNVLFPTVLGNAALETSLSASDIETDSSILEPFGGSAEATLTYYFEVAGPTNSNFQLEVSSQGGGSASNSANSTIGQAVANFTIQSTEGQEPTILDLTAGQNVPQDPSAPGTWSVNQDVTISANTLYVVDLSVQATSGTLIANSTSSAYIDPTFAIDPSNPNANQYTIEYSSNLQAVPEPSTWVLLAGGLGLLAFWRRRRFAKKG
jgi:hypothetical protein